ncbi:YkgJ family cysteine cluster protein [Shewanella algae]|uniref:YkgJ family cysteine cluster protein n=1 Tax=Shewanella algae TaxID=38313 RepID=UPI003D05B934
MCTEQRRAFPCDACGQCCRNVNLSELTAYLDRGDGTCINFCDASKLCSIYETRPLICRVEEYYEKNLSDVYSWEEFIELNTAICKQLKEITE